MDLLKFSLLADSPFPDKITWGRSCVRRSWLRSLLSATPVWLAPLVALSFFITLSQFDGSLSNFFAAVLEEGVLPIFHAHGPQFSVNGMLACMCWIVLQGVLFRYLPGPVNTGQRTPAGHLLAYRTNGLWAWVVTHVLYAALCWFGVLDPGFVPRNWGGLVAAMNLTGFLLSALAYAKAYLMPTHPEDRKFSGMFLFLDLSRLKLITAVVGSAPYDFYMGIELNPRLGDHFDFKLFTNGRPGLISWTLMLVPSSTRYVSSTCSTDMMLIFAETYPTSHTSTRFTVAWRHHSFLSRFYILFTYWISSSTKPGTCGRSISRTTISDSIWLGAVLPGFRRCIRSRRSILVFTRRRHRVHTWRSFLGWALRVTLYSVPSTTRRIGFVVREANA